jgi:hypothetical protein
MRGRYFWSSEWLSTSDSDHSPDPNASSGLCGLPLRPDRASPDWRRTWCAGRGSGQGFDAASLRDPYVWRASVLTWVPEV